MRAPTVLVLLALAAATAAATGCGGTSKEEKAKQQVCAARADIERQLAKVQGLTLTSASVETLTQAFSAVQADLSSIAKAEADLSGQRKQAAQSAVKAFGSQLGTIAGNLVAGVTSGSAAQSQLDAAAKQLAAGFRQAFAPVSC